MSARDGVWFGVTFALAAIAGVSARADFACRELQGLRAEVERLPLADFNSKSPAYRKLVNRITSAHYRLAEQLREMSAAELKAYEKELESCIQATIPAGLDPGIQACIEEQLLPPVRPRAEAKPVPVDRKQIRKDPATVAISAPPIATSAAAIGSGFYVEAAGGIPAATAAGASLAVRAAWLLTRFNGVVAAGTGGYLIGTVIDVEDRARNGGRIGKAVQGAFQPITDRAYGTDDDRLDLQRSYQKAVSVVYAAYRYRVAKQACAGLSPPRIQAPAAASSRRAPRVPAADAPASKRAEPAPGRSGD